MLPAQEPSRGVEPFHGRIRRADDARAQEQAEDLPPAVIVQEDPRRLLGAQRAPADILLLAQRAVLTVIRADVGEQRLEQNAPAPVRQGHRIDPPPVAAAPPPVILLRPARAGQIVPGVIAEDFQFLLRIRLGDDSYHGCSKSVSAARGRNPRPCTTSVTPSILPLTLICTKAKKAAHVSSPFWGISSVTDPCHRIECCILLSNSFRRDAVVAACAR